MSESKYVRTLSLDTLVTLHIYTLEQPPSTLKGVYTPNPYRNYSHQLRQRHIANRRAETISIDLRSLRPQHVAIFQERRSDSARAVGWLQW